MIDVIRLKVISADRLSVVFSDGAHGEFDAKSLLQEAGPLIEPLREPAYFSRVFIEAGAPTWPNGLDLAPEWLKARIAEQGSLNRPKDAA